jgi:hypothetical protein
VLRSKQYHALNELLVGNQKSNNDITLIQVVLINQTPTQPMDTTGPNCFSIKSDLIA